MEFALGIDIGTTGCKCMILDEFGKPVGVKSREYHTFSGADGTSEQSPDEWYRTFILCLEDFQNDGASLNKISTVCATGQMQGTTLIGKDGNTVRNSILWNDLRSHKEAEGLFRRHGDLFQRKIGFPVSPCHSVSQIHWLGKHEPASWEKTEKITFASDYVGYRLSGRIYADENNISFSGLNDVRNNCWSEELIRLAKIDRSKIPELVGCFDVIGRLTSKAADETGLRASIPVIAGGGDVGAETFSIGIAGKKKMKIRLGSAAAINTVVHVDTIKDLPIWPGIRDVMKNYLLIGRYTKACATSIRWVRHVFFSEKPAESATYTLMDQEASLVPPGSEGLLYHPYLFGENDPYINACLRAKFTGINRGHRRGYFLRAAYEGVSFSILDAMNSAKEFDEANEIIFVGGGTKSRLWISILVDVLGKSGIVPEYCDAAYGAALMAGYGCGMFRGEDVIHNNMQNSAIVGFNEERHKMYREIFKKYMVLAGQ